MINEALHPPLPSYQLGLIPHHLLSTTSLILHRLYSVTCCYLQFQNRLCWVPPLSLCSWCSLGSKYPPQLVYLTNPPMPSSHRWNAIPSVKLSFTHSNTLHIFFSFLTVLLTRWSCSTATVCRLISSLACSSLEITDWDFHPCIPGTQHRAWHTAGTQ